MCLRARKGKQALCLGGMMEDHQSLLFPFLSLIPVDHGEIIVATHGKDFVVATIK